MPSLGSTPSLSQRLGLGERYRTLLLPLTLAFVVLAAALAFVSIGSEILEGDTHEFDVQVTQMAFALRDSHPILAEMMRDISGLGSTVVLTLVVVLAMGYLLLVRQWLTALLIACSTLAGSTTVVLLKFAFGRARPDSAQAAFVVEGLSFPSGHAANSAIVYLTVAALIAATRASWHERVYPLIVAAILTGLIGLSRVLLGVHWTTDVMAGWVFGTAWAIVWLLIDRMLTRRTVDTGRPV